MVDKGTVAEAAVTLALMESGVTVLQPLSARSAYDLVVEDQAGRFHRVQVKHGRVRDGCVRFNSCRTDHGQGRRTYHGVADVLVVYVPELRRCFAIDVEAAPSHVGFLRLEPPRNNQRRGVRMAADHTLGRWVEGLRAR